MARDSDSQPAVSVYGQPSQDEDLTQRKRLTRIRRLIGVALLGIISIAVVVVFMPSLLDKFLPQLHLSSLIRRPSSVASTPVDPESLPAVSAVWEGLDLSAVAADVAQDLKSGKYYYDKRFPGNFGRAIGSWKQALARLSQTGEDSTAVATKRKEPVEGRDSLRTPQLSVAPGRTSGRLGATDRENVTRLIAAAERELAGQFTSDSGDAVVLLKQDRRDQAIILLEKMRADYSDIASPQYNWASVMLSRQRR